MSDGGVSVVELLDREVLRLADMIATYDPSRGNGYVRVERQQVLVATLADCLTRRADPVAESEDVQSLMREAHSMVGKFDYLAQMLIDAESRRRDPDDV